MVLLAGGRSNFQGVSDGEEAVMLHALGPVALCDSDGARALGALVQVPLKVLSFLKTRYAGNVLCAVWAIHVFGYLCPPESHF
jgi:hypothetical protein